MLSVADTVSAFKFGDGTRCGFAACWGDVLDSAIRAGLTPPPGKRRIRLAVQDAALSRRKHGFESRMRYHVSHRLTQPSLAFEGGVRRSVHFSGETPAPPARRKHGFESGRREQVSPAS